MRITVDVDDALFAKAKGIVSTGDEADTVNAALESLAANDWLKSYHVWPRSISEELVNSFDPDYDPKPTWQRTDTDAGAARTPHETTALSR